MIRSGYVLFLAWCTLGAGLGALGCGSSGTGAAASDAGAGDGGACSDIYSVNGPYNVTLKPTADSPSACSCSQCSYSLGLGHVTSVATLGAANVEYFMAPLLAADAGVNDSVSGMCGANETSACNYSGSCSYLGGALSSFTFAVTNNGAVSGPQSYVVPGPDGGTAVDCTFDVTAVPAGP